MIRFENTPRKSLQINHEVAYEPVTDEMKFDRAMGILALILRELLEKDLEPQEPRAENTP